MDETALLAFGILLEEASRDALGKRGDLVFTEPATEPKEVARAMQAAKVTSSVSKGPEETGQDVTSKPARKAKRRRVAKEEPSRSPEF